MTRSSTAKTPTPPLVYLSQQTAAGRLGVSVDTIRRRIADGSLPGYRVGGLLRVREADLERLVVPVSCAVAL